MYLYRRRDHPPFIVWRLERPFYFLFVWIWGLACILLTEGGYLLRCSFTEELHPVLTERPRDHTHPLHRRGKGKLSDNANLKRVLQHTDSILTVQERWMHKCNIFIRKTQFFVSLNQWHIVNLDKGNVWDSPQMR